MRRRAQACAPAPSPCRAPSAVLSPLLGSAAPGQPAAPLMSPEKGAAAVGGGEVRGQCNIYSDITFHFYEAGKRCRSRKRAARDVAAWEAAVTPSTTHSRLQRARARLRREPPSDPHRNHTQLGMGSGLSPPPLPSAPPLHRGAEGMAGVGRTSEEQRASPGLLYLRRSPARQELITQRDHPSAP